MRVKLGGLYFDRLTLAQTVRKIIDIAAQNEKKCALVVTPNVDHVLRCADSPDLLKLYKSADLSLADGMPIVWLSKLIGNPLPERVTGADLLPAVCLEAANRGLSVFLLGGPPGAAESASKSLLSVSPRLSIQSFCPPFGFQLSEDENTKAIGAINQFAPDILFVGLGSPKQELWLERYRSRLKVGVGLGVGAAIEFEAGYVKRAPLWMQERGLEWVYRLAGSPLRLAGRYLSNVRFLRVIVTEIMQNRNKSLS